MTNPRLRALLVLPLLLLPLQTAYAAHTAEEQASFFAKQRKDKADFEKALLTETDSRAAAIRQFNDQAQADRISFTQSLADVPDEQQPQLLDEFNAVTLRERKNFQKTLSGLPKSRLEQQLEDFDKRAAEDTRGFVDGLSDADPALRSERVRQFQNDLEQKRAKLRNEAQGELSDKRRSFKQQQAREVHDFFGN